MTQVTDIDQQILEQEEQARAARILLDERQKAQLAPEQALAAATANIAKLTQQRAETVFNEALAANETLIRVNGEAIDRLHKAMAARPVDFNAVRRAADGVQNTFERQQAHVEQAIEPMVDRIQKPEMGNPYLALAAKFTPAIDKGEAALWFMKGKQDNDLKEAQAVVYVLFGQIFNVGKDYDPMATMRQKINSFYRQAR